MLEEQDYLDKQSDFSDDPGEDNIDPVEIPKEVRNLRTQSYDKSVKDLIAMIEDKAIDLDPEYQRSYLWDNKKASLLIESILLNVPIPIIYVSENEESEWSVIDGLQRLSSLYRYYKNEFKLTGLEILNELNGFTYYKLPPKAQRVLGNGMIRVIVLLAETHPEIKYDIFMRLNTGAVQLNEQELRNCLYRGPFNDLLKDLRSNTNFLKCLNLAGPHKRFVDTEIILRFFSIYDACNLKTKKIVYPGKMKTFLNMFMCKYQNANADIIKNYRVLFETTMDNIYTVLGDNAFRRPDKEEGYDTRINRSLIDVVMLCFSHLDTTNCKNNKSEYQDIIRFLSTNDKEFIDAITIGTSDSKKLELRLIRGLETFGLV